MFTWPCTERQGGSIATGADKAPASTWKSLQLVCLQPSSSSCQQKHVLWEPTPAWIMTQRNCIPGVPYLLEEGSTKDGIFSTASVQPIHFFHFMGPVILFPPSKYFCWEQVSVQQPPSSVPDISLHAFLSCTQASSSWWTSPPKSLSLVPFLHPLFPPVSTTHAC